MSLIFWRKARDTGSSHPANVEVNEDNPLPVQLIDIDTADPARVKIDMTTLPPVAGRTIKRKIQIPGIGTGAAYADGESFGSLITLLDVFRPNVHSGVITGLVLHDLDDEGLQVDVAVYSRPITVTVDNSANAPSDADNLCCEGVIAITQFTNWDSNQIGQNTSDRLWVVSDDTNLYLHCVARGALNIAAGAVPFLTVKVVPD